MATDAMLALAHRAKAFAQCYVALTEALMAEGVPEDAARSEARASATMISLANMGSGEPCPLCGER